MLDECIGDLSQTDVDQIPDLLGQTAGIRKSSAALDDADTETVWQCVTPLESPPLPLNTDP